MAPLAFLRSSGRVAEAWEVEISGREDITQQVHGGPGGNQGKKRV